MQCQTTAALFNRAGALFFTASAITQGKASAHFHIAQKRAHAQMDLLSSEMGLERIVSLRRSYKQQKYIHPTHEARCVYAKMDLD
jgi:hypothetical protein